MHEQPEVTSLPLPRVVLVTDRSLLPPGRGLLATVRECTAAGLRAVVVREHDLSVHARALLLRDLARIDGLMVISSRSPCLTAHGLHLAAHQPAPRSGRWGRSCHSRQDVARAAGEGAAWATLSPYAPSRSKPGRPPLPADSWAGHPVPVLALAGVDATNARAAIEAGAHGVAVMGAVMRADDPASVVAQLLGEVG
ncbi:thiamine phosphate synthase [Nocardioides seonyuensis]|uniref:thiamine phosphate synthase n=1 Tax=Nocardioides seonyuensis TaxID=2518371 RepID=UPI00141DFA33|nr:thiamine phosphate synthase [Nocardioides seonyuensis]